VHIQNHLARVASGETHQLDFPLSKSLLHGLEPRIEEKPFLVADVPPRMIVPSLIVRTCRTSRQLNPHFWELRASRTTRPKSASVNNLLLEPPKNTPAPPAQSTEATASPVHSTAVVAEALS
jgi:hypothetical protein